MNLEYSVLKDILNVAIKAAVRGGKTVYRHWNDFDRDTIIQKSSWKDLVTVADKESEKVVVSTIIQSFPEHIIISEEGSISELSDQNSPFSWAIDPLDGTTNFCHSYPFFCTSIGIIYKGHSVVGVVYDPTRDELFTAIRGHGAYLNGRPIRVSNIRNLSEALLVTGFAYSGDNAFQRASHELFIHYNNTCHGIRRDGAAALDLCYVAAGRLEGFWEYGLNVWDVAAGSLIVSEAGGLVSDPMVEGDINLFAARILASNPHIHEHMLSDIRNITEHNLTIK